jgi:hypothetical protein
MDPRVLAIRGPGSPGDDPNAAPRPPQPSDLSLRLLEGMLIPKTQARLSVNMYAATHGGKRFVPDHGECLCFGWESANLDSVPFFPCVVQPCHLSCRSASPRKYSPKVATQWTAVRIYRLELPALPALSACGKGSMAVWEKSSQRTSCLQFELTPLPTGRSLSD